MIFVLLIYNNGIMTHLIIDQVVSAAVVDQQLRLQCVTYRPVAGSPTPQPKELLLTLPLTQLANLQAVCQSLQQSLTSTPTTIQENKS